jgi:phosphoribosylglycinamide formyltransferase-1
VNGLQTRSSARASPPTTLAVMLSGRGSNLGYLLQCIEQQRLPARVCAVISNRPAAPGLQHVFQHRLAAHVLDYQQFNQWQADADLATDQPNASKRNFERRLSDAIVASGAEWIVLAGFMRILTAAFVSRHAGRIINLHPSLLPAYPGLDTHARALAAGESQYGASIHFVNAELDCGPVLAQVRLPISHGATAASMTASLRAHEHRLLAACIALFSQHTVTCDNNQIMIDHQCLSQPLLLDQNLHWP